MRKLRLMMIRESLLLIASCSHIRAAAAYQACPWLSGLAKNINCAVICECEGKTRVRRIKRDTLYPILHRGNIVSKYSGISSSYFLTLLIASDTINKIYSDNFTATDRHPSIVPRY